MVVACHAHALAVEAQQLLAAARQRCPAQIADLAPPQQPLAELPDRRAGPCQGRGASARRREIGTQTGEPQAVGREFLGQPSVECRKIPKPTAPRYPVALPRALPVEKAETKRA